MEAIRAANERKVRELLEDINQDDNDDASPLALQSAPALSVDVNQIYMGRTPVLHVVDRIIQRLGENDPETPDHVAALVSILRLLVDNGGRLPLEGSIATSVEDVPVLSRLFEGLRVAYVTFADPNPSSSSSRSQSVPSTLEGAIKLLVDSLDVPLTQDCCEHLHQAARRGDVHMMTFMVEQLHLDPNMPGRQGMTPLMVRTISEANTRESEKTNEESRGSHICLLSRNPAACGTVRSIVDPAVSIASRWH
jgi:hypothetical protein